MRPRFSSRHRNLDPELMDGPVPPDDLALNYRELATINRLLGGYAPTLWGLRQLLRDWDGSRPIRILDVGSGGGDTLQAVASWCKRQGIKAHLMGLDLSEVANRSAGRLQYAIQPQFHVGDATDATMLAALQPDIVMSALFCHHLSPDVLRKHLSAMRASASLGVVINDLQRHPLAYHAIGLLTRHFSKSYLVQADAPHSVARGFAKDELQSAMQAAGFANSRVRWIWAFRFAVVGRC